MRVRFIFPSQLEARIVGFTAEGKRVEVREVLVEPLFFRSDAKPACLFIEVQDCDGEVITQHMAHVSGVNGDFRSIRREQRSTTYDTQKKKRQAKEAVDENVGTAPAVRK